MTTFGIREKLKLIKRRRMRTLMAMAYGCPVIIWNGSTKSTFTEVYHCVNADNCNCEGLLYDGEMERDLRWFVGILPLTRSNLPALPRNCPVLLCLNNKDSGW